MSQNLDKQPVSSNLEVSDEVLSRIQGRLEVMHSFDSVCLNINHSESSSISDYNSRFSTLLDFLLSKTIRTTFHNQHNKVMDKIDTLHGQFPDDTVCDEKISEFLAEVKLKNVNITHTEIFKLIFKDFCTNVIPEYLYQIESLAPLLYVECLNRILKVLSFNLPIYIELFRNPEQDSEGLINSLRFDIQEVIDNVLDFGNQSGQNLDMQEILLSEERKKFERRRQKLFLEMKAIFRSLPEDLEISFEMKFMEDLLETQNSKIHNLEKYKETLDSWFNKLILFTNILKSAIRVLYFSNSSEVILSLINNANLAEPFPAYTTLVEFPVEASDEFRNIIQPIVDSGFFDFDNLKLIIDSFVSESSKFGNLLTIEDIKAFGEYDIQTYFSSLYSNNNLIDINNVRTDRKLDKFDEKLDTIYIVVGPSGSGKDSIVDATNSVKVKSASNRPIREGENPDDMERMREKRLDETDDQYLENLIEEYGLVEYDRHNGGYIYGLPESNLKAAFSSANDRPVIIRTENNGLKTLEEKLKGKYNIVPILITAESYVQLWERMINRDQPLSYDQMIIRIRKAANEIRDSIGNVNFVLMNQDTSDPTKGITKSSQSLREILEINPKNLEQ